jgi:type III pantothenate kinase
MQAQPTSEFLIIDISNSYTKLVPASRDHLEGEVSRIATKELTPEALEKVAGACSRYGRIVLSSVVPKATKAVEAYAATDCTAAASAKLLKVSKDVKLGVGIDYPDPKSIGADRLANAAGAVAFYGAPTVVVDFGTAVTFDVIAESSVGPQYVGGVIAPGLAAMTDYLYQRTALLPRIELSEPVTAIGKSTKEAMLAGAVYGYRGLVREILSELRRELKAARHLKVVATGGYAELISESLPEIQEVHPNLTLEGVRMIGVLNS